MYESALCYIERKNNQSMNFNKGKKKRIVGVKEVKGRGESEGDVRCGDMIYR